MPNRRHLLSIVCLAGAAAMAASCGGGGGGAGNGPGPGLGTSLGTLRVALTDAPACGYDSAFVTVEKVRIHQSAAAGEADAGWSELVPAMPVRVDLLTLNNGTLLPLGQVELPAGVYTQMRLVLAANTASAPLANAIKPTGGVETALTTPSGQQSGLKMNVNLSVPAGQVADVAIDFDGCKSFVRAGNSGQILLKPVLSVLPILSTAGQRVVGFVDASLASTGTSVSLQAAGVPVRATAPDSSGRFTLYPVPAGQYDLVITATGRVNAVMTGVPVTNNGTTLIGSDAVRLNPPLAAATFTASGTVRANGSTAATGASVRAMQTLSAGPAVEVGYAAAHDTTGAYSLRLPAGAPARVVYAAGAGAFVFASDGPAAGSYRLEASVPGMATKSAPILLPPDVVVPFSFP